MAPPAAAAAVLGSCAAPAPRFVRDALARSAAAGANPGSPSAGSGAAPTAATATSGVKLLTLAILRKGDRLLLGRKKRGFGEGYVNGFGGKVEAGERVEAAAAREVHEECGVEAGPLAARGVLTFVFDDQPRPWEVHVFTASDFRGDPIETDEMRPEWFEARAGTLPFGEMWADDRHWWPLLLRPDAPLFHGLFAFTETHTLGWWRLREVPDLSLARASDLLEAHPAAAAVGEVAAGREPAAADEASGRC